jgi:hypothetical protein
MRFANERATKIQTILATCVGLFILHKRVKEPFFLYFNIIIYFEYFLNFIILL